MNQWKWMAMILVTAVLAACGQVETALQTGDDVLAEADSAIEVEIPGLTVSASQDAMILESDAIFLGRVDYISETMFNDGEAYHHIAVSVLTPVVDDVGLGSGAVLTWLGESPLTAPDSAAMRPAATHQLEVGDEMIFFVQESVLENGRYAAAVLAPVPNTTKTMISGSQLQDVLTQVDRLRPILVQPVDDEVGAY